MPVLFVGHGSPMNAVQDNPFTRALAELGKNIPRPKSILCVSAHWYVDGTFVSVSPTNKMIHDFAGFPSELYAIQYPAPGEPAAAQKAQDLLGKSNSRMTGNWGLDHGAWTVLMHMFPKADIPVFQISLDMRKSPADHFDLGAKLKSLREEGVLILGSGNIVHNLRKINFSDTADPYPWNVKFDAGIKEAILKRDADRLVNFAKFFPEETPLAVPTPDHYLPLLYAFACSDKDDPVSFPYEGFELSGISMRAVRWG